MKLIDLLLFCITVSGWCVGLFYASELILKPIDEWLANNTKDWMYKPLIGCIYCMASIHSILLWLVLQPFAWYYLVIAIPIVCAFNKLLYKE